MIHRPRTAAVTAAGALLLLSTVAASAANAVATRPMSVYAAPNANARVVGLIGVSQVVDARKCRKGWCTAQGGYVQSAYLRFTRAAAESGYDYNVPLPFPPYGYTLGFWGYGGKRYYDRYGNYTKYGQQGYAGTPRRFGTPPGATIPRRAPFGRR